MLFLDNNLQDEVRKIAALMDLPNKDRKDSQGICFLGKVSCQVTKFRCHL